jgi:hypothetical protein
MAATITLCVAAAICGAYAIATGSGGTFDLPIGLSVLAAGSAAVLVAVR